MVSRIAFLFDTQNIKVGPVIFLPSPQIPRLLRPCIGTLLGGKFGVIIGGLSVQAHQGQLGLPSFPGWYMSRVTLAFTKGLKTLESFQSQLYSLEAHRVTAAQEAVPYVPQPFALLKRVCCVTASARHMRKLCMYHPVCSPT